MTPKRLAKCSSTNRLRKQARDDFETACDGLVLKPIVETSRHDFEKAGKGLVLKLIEETSKT